MKYLLLFSLTLLPLTSFSKEKDYYKDFEKKMEKMSYEEAKKEKLDKIEMKMKLFEDEKKCINDTIDKEGIKKCMKEAKKEMEKEKK